MTSKNSDREKYGGMSQNQQHSPGHVFNCDHGSRNGFSGGSQKIIGVYPAEGSEAGSHFATGAAHSLAGVQGQRPGNFLTSLPIFEHGLQFRFNEITYFLEHYFIG